MKRQNVRKLILIISMLLFPLTIWYMSPYLIIQGAMEGTVTGSFIVFLLMLLGSIFFGIFFSPYFMPLPLLSELLAIGGKSLVEYMYLFILGYYVFADEKIINKAEKNCWLLFGIGLVATILNTYLFIWSDKEFVLLDTVTKYVSEWIMIIALIGLAKRYLNFSGKVSSYMNKRSFLFYIYHFTWVVLIQYILYGIVGNHAFILFMGTVLLAYGATFICCEISIRIPFMCFLTGIKYSSKK